MRAKISSDHFPRHGFLLDETELVESCQTEYGGDEVVDGFVFSLDSNAQILENVEQVKKLADRLGFKPVVHLKMPRRAEGIAFTDDRQIANAVAEAILAATAAKEVELFLDTLVDQDRGYYPRNGLMDRRYNPRLAYHVFRHLHHALGNYQGTFTTSRIGDPSKDRVFSIRTDSYECLLLLSASQGIKAVLDSSLQRRLTERGFSYLELHTGRLKKVEPKADTALASLSLEKSPLLIMIPTETQ